jgi:GT2 family glycosyltransferase
LTFNGTPWLEACLRSLREQTLAEEFEIIVADNASSDSSSSLASQLLDGCENGHALRIGTNLGYSAGNNYAGERARGKYLLFLNHDTWLEPDCLEKLMDEVKTSGAAVASPLVLDYSSDTVQTAGWSGFDIFGFLSGPTNLRSTGETFIASGCAMLVEARLFRQLGGFDPTFFMYADEYDFCWRAWLAGSRVIVARSARAHHRGAVEVNPRGYRSVVELRTSDTKRHYANRNGLLVLLKNCQHLLLCLLPLQLGLLTLEALVTGFLTRRWTHVRRAYLDVLADCWKLRRHILAERRRIRSVRKCGDFWMLRFLRAGLNRWGELRRWRVFGCPQIEER